ncbi:SMP-30/gluconolactonase/LRE family protein [Lignipirellula cremea]|uniref:Gluconolactonase n=1 Tax=Lignipirellula cremea TaxID=2528010 RepID=A0A518DUB4_9BACT|nr:SMP-30/gluconolactonase/LRE family protein [Lignipirellula cremea]QDU95416.1 Gluconolactonase precursor [Lignipirellula cremea]
MLKPLAIGVLLLSLCGSLQAGEPVAEIGKLGEVRQLHTDLMFTEGPTSDAKGNVYFTDIPADRIYKIDAAGELSVFVEPAQHANGLMLIKGQLFACEMDGQIVKYDVASRKRTVICPGYDDKRFNAPNDLVVDQHGGVYFTDPHFRAPDPMPQDKLAVYYLSAEGETTRLADDLKAPNGVILSPDEKTLYVVPSLQKQMMAYPVEGPGKLGEGRVFCELKQAEGVDNTGGDGLTIDSKGNLYITSRLGLQVFSPEGKLLGIIELPEQPSNAVFGGKGNSTLFVTARKSVYAIDTHAKGHRFPGPKAAK